MLKICSNRVKIIAFFKINAIIYKKIFGIYFRKITEINSIKKARIYFRNYSLSFLPSSIKIERIASILSSSFCLLAQLKMSSFLALVTAT